MKQPSASRAARSVGWLLAAATLLLAALLIAQCADIYRAGTSAENLTEAGVRIHDMYSPQIVAERFVRIRWAFVAWLALLLAAVAARLIAPDERQAARPSPESALERTLPRLTLTPAMCAEERKRRVVSVACAVVCTLCAAVVAAYFADLGHFASRELEGVVGAMLRNVLPWVALTLAALLIAAYLVGKSLTRELAAAKDAPRRSPEPPAAPKRALRLIGRAALYVAAILLIIAGVTNGGMHDVLVKAINICTECIGLG